MKNNAVINCLIQVDRSHYEEFSLIKPSREKFFEEIRSFPVVNCQMRIDMDSVKLRLHKSSETCWVEENHSDVDSNFAKSFSRKSSGNLLNSGVPFWLSQDVIDDNTTSFSFTFILITIEISSKFVRLKKRASNRIVQVTHGHSQLDFVLIFLKRQKQRSNYHPDLRFIWCK